MSRRNTKIWLYSFIIALIQTSIADAHVFPIDLTSSDAVYISDFGIFQGINGNSVTYSHQSTVPTNASWADSTDADWGNSHNLAWYSFNIINPRGAYVGITAERSGITESTDADGIPFYSQIADLNPAFSLYRGTVPKHSHDDILPIPGKEGNVQAFADTTMANEEGEQGTMHYLTHSGSVGNQTDKASIDKIFLEAGLYTIIMGGSCYTCQPPNPNDFDLNDPDAYQEFQRAENFRGAPRGYNLNLSITAVPIPGTIWLFAPGIATILSFRRKSRI